LIGLAVLGSAPTARAQSNLPEKQEYELRSHHSSATLELFSGTYSSAVSGIIRIYMGDPDVPAPAEIPGAVGLSVYRVEYTTPDWIGLPRSLVLDPSQPSIGWYNTLTGYIQFELYLMSPDGSLPVPMPLHMRGVMQGGYLWVSGDNGNVVDAHMILTIGAIRRDIYFSTEVAFTPGVPPYMGHTISPGDLVSEAGQLVATNYQLVENFGIQPMVPDVGLDAVYQVGIGPRFFSTEIDEFSEILGRTLGHGDLLAQAGYIARTNAELVSEFMPMPPVPDLGLDAVHRLPNGIVLFSTEDGFFSEALGIWINDGDLLSETGVVVQNNYQLMTMFSPGGPIPIFGTDAVYLPPPRMNTTVYREIWFSTEDPFFDYGLGPISDGDLLSTNGSVVRRNLELLEEFAPLEDLDNFGLDAVHVRRPLSGDTDGDNDVDLVDFATFSRCFGSSVDSGAMPDCSSVELLASDLDGNGYVDLVDFATFAIEFTG
jgi:hypothetical protein